MVPLGWSRFSTVSNRCEAGGRPDAWTPTPLLSSLVGSPAAAAVGPSAGAAGASEAVAGAGPASVSATETVCLAVPPWLSSTVTVKLSVLVCPGTSAAAAAAWVTR